MKYTACCLKDSIDKDSNHIIYSREETDSEVHYYIKSIKHPCLCPECGSKSETLAAVDERVIQDVPENGKTKWLHFKVGTYICENKDCKKHCFTEEISIAGKNQRRSHDLNFHIINACANQNIQDATRQLKFEGVKISDETVRKLVKKVTQQNEKKTLKDREVIGIDEVALKKGQSYATVVYDLLNKEPLLLFKNRDKETVVEHLKNKFDHIDFVCRDRWVAFKNALKIIAPDSQQIVDIFHLYENLGEAIRQFLEETIPSKLYFSQEGFTDKKPKQKPYNFESLVDLKTLDYDTSPPIDDKGNLLNFKIYFSSNLKRDKERAKKRKQKNETLEKMRKYYFDSDQRITYVDLGSQFGVSPATASKYVKMTQEEFVQSLQPPNRKHSSINKHPYLNTIYKMMKDGIDNSTIFNYVLQMPEFDTTEETLIEYINAVIIANFPERSQFGKFFEKVNFECISPKDIQHFICTKNKTKKEHGKLKLIEENLDNLKKAYPVIDQAFQLFNVFENYIKSNEPEQFDEFIKNCPKDQFESLIANFKNEKEEICNALKYPFNSGKVEGLNNKLKLFKRSGYGKYSVDMLLNKLWLSWLFNHTIKIVKSYLSSLNLKEF